MVLTEKQIVVLNAINDFVTDNRYPPTTRELAEIVGLKSNSTAHGYLNRLKERGYIQWEPDRPRTIKILFPKGLTELSIEKYVGRVVEIVYKDKSGRFSQRKIRVEAIEDGKVRAFDVGKQAPRVFEIDRILAALPVIGRVS